MNEKIEKILDILSKEKPTEEELKILESELESNSELKKYKTVYELARSIVSDSHIDDDLIAEYVLFSHESKLSDEKLRRLMPKIETHIQSCDECKATFVHYSAEYSEVDQFVQSKFESNSETSQSGKTRLFSLLNYRSAISTAAAVILIYFSLFTISELTTPGFKNLDSVPSISDYSSSRGRASAEFQRGIDALRRNAFNEAILYLQTDIRSNPEDETLFYTHYVLGLVYLKSSERTFAGLFPSFDDDQIDNAISSFEKSIELNKLRAFANIKFNTYYFLGKAFILKENFTNAKKYLRLSIESRSEYSAEAAKLLNSISG